MYRMNNGLPIDDPASGYDEDNPYENREQRFYQSILYDSTMWKGILFTVLGGGDTEGLNSGIGDVKTGYRRIKGCDPSLGTSNLFEAETCNTPVLTTPKTPNKIRTAIGALLNFRISG